MRTSELWRAFAEREAAGSSPTYEQVAHAVAADERVLTLLDGLPPAKRQPNLLLGVGRLLGAPLSWEAFAGWVVDHWDEVRPEVLSRSTQTNEPGRCATLLPVLATIPGPLALLEVGASAGLCLYPDRYRYDYGHGVVGAGPGPVLRCRWDCDQPPPTRVPEVVWRAGVDLNPLDLTDPADLAWLQALVWPEQHERRDRLAAAARVLVADPPYLVSGDLGAELEALAAQAPRDATLVVLHSAVLAYLEPPARQDFVDAVRGLPGHWVANESPRVLEGLVDDPGPLPDVATEGPAPFLTTLDGAPSGWSGPHGQSWDCHAGARHG